VKHKAENYLGWYGVLAILLAYLLLSFNVIGAKSFSYQLLNLTGALGIIIEAMSKKDIQPAVLNVIWAVIALAAILRLAAN
jgi:hypothetical protein